METPNPFVGHRPTRKMSHLRLPATMCLVFASILGMILIMFSLASMGSGKKHSPIQSTHASTIPTHTTPSEHVASTTTPDYFQTSPEVLPGPTRLASIAPFLAQTNPAPFPSASYTPPSPIETSYPITGNSDHTNVFHLMGHLSPYFPSPGFGTDEHHLPPGTNITTAHLLHRHGSRYPTSDSTVALFGAKIQSTNTTWTGALSFLNSWSYALGAESLVALGRNELFSSGVSHFYSYGHLSTPTSPILVRTTSQDRMLQSAAHFLAGFFGPSWPNNATLEPILEGPGFNNSLAAYFACSNNFHPRSLTGDLASQFWQDTYLADATKRLRKLSSYDWTTRDTYDAQTLCSYETVAFGYSRFCDLFTLDEWRGFEYSIDLQFAGSVGYMSPTGRAVGIAWVEEFRARLHGDLYKLPDGATGANATLDRSRTTFPLDQKLYLDFSHDTNIYAILTAMGIRISGVLSNNTITEGIPVSHVTPFAARVVWEQITAPKPVKATRGSGDEYEDGGETEYVHMLIGQRTVPLGESHPECGQRDDGWCEKGVFLKVLDGLLDKAKYEYSCFGDYDVPRWGDVTDGVARTT